MLRNREPGDRRDLVPFLRGRFTIARMPAQSASGSFGPGGHDGGQVGVGFTGVSGQMVGNRRGGLRKSFGNGPLGEPACGFISFPPNSLRMT